MTQLPGGMRFLINLRADLIAALSQAQENRPDAFVDLDENLKAFLQRWFALGFLDMREISWDSPASLLEKVQRTSFFGGGGDYVH